MGRALLASILLHMLVVVVAALLGVVGGAVRRPLPPVYQVQLVSAAELSAVATRPEPRPEESVEEETPPEPEEVEEVPAPEAPPRPRPAGPREPTPRPGPEAARNVGSGMSLSLEGRPFAFDWYLEQLVRKVRANWRPTTSVLRATIHFRIDRSGVIQEVEVERPSGNFLFDQAAVRAIEAANPMPPLPRDYDGDWLGVYLDFDMQARLSQ
jgi:TonB family protein